MWWCVVRFPHYLMTGPHKTTPENGDITIKSINRTTNLIFGSLQRCTSELNFYSFLPRRLVYEAKVYITHSVYLSFVRQRNQKSQRRRRIAVLKGQQTWKDILMTFLSIVLSFLAYIQPFYFFGWYIMYFCSKNQQTLREKRRAQN